MKYYISLLSLTILTFIAITASPALALRCGGEIASTGDRKERVMMICGPPTYQSNDMIEKVVGVDRFGNPVVQYKPVETWLYNCGESDFAYKLTFEGGTLFHEEPVGRGQGRGTCRK